MGRRSLSSCARISGQAKKTEILVFRHERTILWVSHPEYLYGSKAAELEGDTGAGNDRNRAVTQ